MNNVYENAKKRKKISGNLMPMKKIKYEKSFFVPID